MCFEVAPCCKTGRKIQRTCITAAWVLFALPVRIVDTLFVAWPVYLIWDVLRRDIWMFFAGLSMGLVYSFAVFLPLARVFSDYSRPLCLTYVTVMGWYSGHLLMALFVHAKMTAPLSVVKRGTPFGFSFKALMKDGAVLGMIFGLSFAFPVLTTERDDSVPGGVEWCRGDSKWHIAFYFLPAVAAACLNVKRGAKWPETATSAVALPPPALSDRYVHEAEHAEDEDEYNGDEDDTDDVASFRSLPRGDPNLLIHLPSFNDDEKL